MAVPVEAFQPNSSYTITATAASSNTALTQPPGVTGVLSPAGANASAGNAGGYTVIRVYNPSATVAAYLNPTNTTTAATATSPFIVPPASWQTFEMGGPYTNLAVIMASAGTVTIYVMLGSGGV